MARITCGHCGLTHASVAEVRACSSDNAPTPPSGQAPPSDRPTPDQPTPDQNTPSGLPVSVEQLAGPDWLGRCLLIEPDGEVGEPWHSARRISVDARASGDVIDELQRIWQLRERVVFEWTGQLPSAWPAIDTPFHELAPDYEIPGERLQFFLTANTVWALDDLPVFEPVSLALSLKATLSENASDTNNENSNENSNDRADGDVVLGDGTQAWADGGPLDLQLPAHAGPIIPRVHLVAGSLRPVQPQPTCAAELASDQLEAVTHRTGPARILAPAGSGKTRVLTERTRYLVNDCGVTPAAVTLVAYNRRAKDEMSERLGDVGRLDIRTLNSFALAIANGSGPFIARRGGTATTIDELQARRLVGDLVPGRRRRQLTDALEPWIDALSACRLGLRDPHEVESAYGGDITGFVDVLPAYRAALADRRLFDFDEQILSAIERLLREPDVRRMARRLAPMLLVDEFQDLTPAHLLLLKLVAGPSREVFAVGDDDQTIYGYAGASPQWLVDFDRFVPEATDHHLTVNYRCPSGVVDAAVSLLSYNRHRVPKKITAGAPEADQRSDGFSEQPIVLEGDPQASLLNRVKDLVDVGVDPASIAVLTRVHAALLPAAVHLWSAGIPVVRPRGLDRRVLERSGVAAALAWLRLATAPAQRLVGDDIRLALRRPPRSLHPRITDWACEQESLPHLRALAQRLNTERDAATINAFADDLEQVRTLAESGSTVDLLEMIYHEIGLLGAASQLDQSQRTARRAAHADELAALVAIADLQPDAASFEQWLVDLLATMPTATGEPTDDAAPSITLATVHTTKGLEWPHVIVHDVRDNLFPHRLAEDIEEERRVFHVALTRARHSLTLTLSGPPSRFVAELLEPRGDEPWPEVRSSGAPPNKATGPGKRPAPGRSEAADQDEATRREGLTQWRRERAKKDGVPAYVVLDNKTLDAIAARVPADLAGLGAISGIGPVKLDRYGADILGVLHSSG